MESMESFEKFSFADVKTLEPFDKSTLKGGEDFVHDQDSLLSGGPEGFGGNMTPRTAYALGKQNQEELSLKLLTNLDSGTMASIKEQFKSMGDTVNMVEFVAVMEAHLPDQQVDDAPGGGDGGVGGGRRRGGHWRGGGAAARLVELFREVDVNGDGRLEWEEFTRFIVEKAQQYHALRAVAGPPPYRPAARSVEDLSRHHHKGPVEKLLFLRGSAGKRLRDQARAAAATAAGGGAAAAAAATSDSLEGAEPGGGGGGGGGGGRHHGHGAGAAADRPDKVAVLEQMSTEVTVYNARTWAKMAALPHRAVPLSAAYLEERNLLATCCADMHMCLWALDGGQRTRHWRRLARWPAGHAQMSLVWAGAHALLYSGSTTGEICAWDLGLPAPGADPGAQGYREANPRPARDKHLRGHADIVMDLLVIESMAALVSASLDATICLWDTYTGARLRRLTGHQKGVFALSYSEEYRCLVSAGFDHEAYVWSPFVAQKLATLSGHHGSLVGCQCVEGGREVVTADAAGTFKVWDLRNFGCRATFCREPDPHDPGRAARLLTFLHLALPPVAPRGGGGGGGGRGGRGPAGAPGPPVGSAAQALLARAASLGGTASLGGGGGGGGGGEGGEAAPQQMDYRILAAGRKLYYFDQERLVKEAVTDDHPLACVAYNAGNVTVLTAAERSVKIWDAVFGTLKRHFADVCPGDITAVCLDDRRRKFVVGDALGNIQVHNYQNGALMKALPPLPRAAVALRYCPGHRSVLAAAADRTVRVYDETDPEKAAVLQEFHESRSFGHRRGEDLQCLAYSHNLRLVATGATNPADGSDGIIIWDFDLGKGQLALRVPGADFTLQALEFLGARPLLAAAGSDGLLRLWGVERARARGVCLLVLPNPRLREDYLDEGLFAQASEQATAGGPNPLGLGPGPSLETLQGGAGGAPTARTSPVLALCYDEEGQALYTGDEAGGLKKWDLSQVLAQVGEPPVESPRVVAGQSRTTVIKTPFARASLSMDLVRQFPLPAAAAALAWGLRAAHEGAVEHVALAEGRRALVTAGADRTVRAWTPRGEARGALVQHLAAEPAAAAAAPPGAKGPGGWDLPVDAAGRAAAEVADVAEVERQVEELIEEQRQLLGGGEGGAEGAGSSWVEHSLLRSASFRKTTSFMQDDSNKINGNPSKSSKYKNPFHRRIANSQKLLHSLEQEDENMRALQGSKTYSMPALNATGGLLSATGEFGLPSSRSQRSGGSFQSASSRRRAQRARQKKLPTILPPAPGRRVAGAARAAELAEKMGNLQRLLDNWEAGGGPDGGAGKANPFGGAMASVEDFVQVDRPEQDEQTAVQNSIGGGTQGGTSIRSGLQAGGSHFSSIEQKKSSYSNQDV